MKTITLNKWNYEGLTETCSTCEGTGIRKNWTRTCIVCNGKGKLLPLPGKKNKRKCKKCEGHGYVSLDIPDEFPCERCEQKGILPVDRTSKIEIKEHLDQMFNLIDFENNIAGKQTFNEGYLGFGIVGGVTDYGRYLKMSSDEFKQEVKENFYNGFHQYCHYENKDRNLPIKIIIKKTSSGWFLYPIFE